MVWAVLILVSLILSLMGVEAEEVMDNIQPAEEVQQRQPPGVEKDERGMVSTYVSDSDCTRRPKQCLLKAAEAAKENWNKIQHECGNPEDWQKCTPYAYFGSELCPGYKDHGGNSANFVSIMLVQYGGLNPFTSSFGSFPCYGSPCGFENPRSDSFAACLFQEQWTSSCGWKLSPQKAFGERGAPIGSVVIYAMECETYYSSSSSPAQIAILTGENTVTTQSPNKLDVSWEYFTSIRPYVQYMVPPYTFFAEEG